MPTSSTQSKSLLKYSDITTEQQASIDRLYSYDSTLLIASKGFGKCMVAHTAAQEMISDGGLDRVLVLAPPKVCALTWATEHLKWSHLGPVTMIQGTPAQREKKLIAGGAICVCSTELVPWLVKQPGFQSFDGLIIDEISRFKSVGGTAFKALRHKLKGFKWRVGLSATPVAEAGEHIYGQCLLLDDGRALGKNKERFMGTYFMSDYMGYNWELQPGGAERIAQALSGLVHVTESTDYEASLPPLREHIVEVNIGDAMGAYEEMAQTMVLELEGDDDVEAPNAAVLAGKLQQLASGFIYFNDGESTQHMHGAKLFAMLKLVNQLAQPVVISYQYRWELDELRKLFTARGKYVRVLGEDPEGSVAAWNDGECEVLLVHPRSAGHGINLQFGGCVLIQMGPIWSADQSDQIIGRIWRRGQKNPVHRYVLCSKGTIDYAILDRLTDKKDDESTLMEHLRKVTQK